MSVIAVNANAYDSEIREFQEPENENISNDNYFNTNIFYTNENESAGITATVISIVLKIYAMALSLSLIFEAVVCFKECQSRHVRSYVLSVYYIIFALMVFAIESKIKRILKWFTFFRSNSSKAILYIFLGTIAFDEKWWTCIIGANWILLGILNFCEGRRLFVLSLSAAKSDFRYSAKAVPIQAFLATCANTNDNTKKIELREISVSANENNLEINLNNPTKREELR